GETADGDDALIGPGLAEGLALGERLAAQNLEFAQFGTGAADPSQKREDRQHGAGARSWVSVSHESHPSWLRSALGFLTLFRFRRGLFACCIDRPFLAEYSHPALGQYLLRF